MKRDTLTNSKRHASFIKATTLALLLASSAVLVADDSRIPMVRLHNAALCCANDARILDTFAQRMDELFAQFFSLDNNQPFKEHKDAFIKTIQDLECFLKDASIDKNTHKELSHMVKEMYAFMATLESKAQPVLKKGKNASYTDIMPLAVPLKAYAHLIPDIYFSSLPAFLKSILHRLRC